MKLTPGKYRGLRRLSDDDGFFLMTAVSQRPAMEQMVARYATDGTFDFERVVRLKSAILNVWSRNSTAVLVDPQYAYPAAAQQLDHRAGLIIAAEQGVLERTHEGIRNYLFDRDIVAKAKRLGADGLNLSLWFRPDASPQVVRHQKSLVETVGAQCRAADIPFLLSPLSYALDGEHAAGADYQDALLETVGEFQQERYGVDVFQLENPLPSHPAGEGAAAQDPGAEAERYFSRLGSAIEIPWVMLTAGSGLARFRQALGHAFRSGASGYLAGRAFWARQAESYPDLDAVAERLRLEMIPVAVELKTATRAHATPWFRARRFDRGVSVDAGDNFYQRYSAFG